MHIAPTVAVFLAYLPYMSKTAYIALAIGTVGVTIAFYIFRQVYISVKHIDPAMAQHVRRVKQIAPSAIDAVVAGGWAKITGEVQPDAADGQAVAARLTDHLRGTPAPRGATNWTVQSKELKAAPFELRDATGRAQVQVDHTGRIDNNTLTCSLVEASGCVFLFRGPKHFLDQERIRRRVQTIRAGDRVTVVGQPELVPDGSAGGYREAGSAVPCFSAAGAPLYVLHGSEGDLARAASGNRARLLIAGTCVLLAAATGATLVLTLG